MRRALSYTFSFGVLAVVAHGVACSPATQDLGSTDPTGLPGETLADRRPPPANVPYGDIGKPCISPIECSSGTCVPITRGTDIGGVCSRTCEVATDCLAGWTCLPTGAGPSVCSCPAPAYDDVCDGLDNDCNGTIDDNPTLSCGANSECRAGTCTCTGDAVLCGGACLDIRADEANCGACGNVCGDGQACVDGTCRCDEGTGEACAKDGKMCGVGGRCLTVTKTELQGWLIRSLDVVSEHVIERVGYTTTMTGYEETSIASSTLGSPRVTLEVGSRDLVTIVGLDGAKLAYARYGAPEWAYPTTIYACDDPLCATGKRTLLEGTNEAPHALFVVGDTVYWERNGVTFACAHAGCGGAPTLLGNLGGALVAADASGLYGLANGALVVMPLSGGATTTLTSTADARRFRLDATTVYWSTATGISSCPKSGCVAPKTVVAIPLPDFAIDGTYAYWTQSDAQGFLWRAPKDGSGLPEAIVKLGIASSSEGRARIGVDAAAVFVAGDNTMVRLGK